MTRVLLACNNAVPGGPVFESVAAVNQDMSQGVQLLKSVHMSGNDYVAVLKHCKPGVFDQPVKLQVPLKAMFQRYSAAVVGSLPAVKEINIVKSSEKLQGVKHVKQQQVGVPAKKSRTDHGSVSTSQVATVPHQHG